MSANALSSIFWVLQLHITKKAFKLCRILILNSKMTRNKFRLHVVLSYMRVFIYKEILNVFSRDMAAWRPPFWFISSTSTNYHVVPNVNGTPPGVKGCLPGWITVPAWWMPPHPASSYTSVYRIGALIHLSRCRGKCSSDQPFLRYETGVFWSIQGCKKV